MYICICTCMYVCMYVCMYIYIYIYMYTGGAEMSGRMKPEGGGVAICMYVCVYTYTYIHTYLTYSASTRREAERFWRCVVARCSGRRSRITGIVRGLLSATHTCHIHMYIYVLIYIYLLIYIC